ncbi:hypothetical protein DV517_75060 [Streptomyces sp. S816]|uniref:zeta toxin family protein n=1 Tax=Streptomyces sp. S816 TaxID=2283197 RepID=UPI001139C6BC|nr:zeta toxin family protein [Streptomyces sp. S816]TGZ12411.1 hypothetical protein DV517_75060 [Streptomyces sp. S816]
MAGAGDTGALLPDEKLTDVLKRVILPGATRDAVRQQQPVVVVVAGQPGAGKTRIADLVQAALDRRGGSVRISPDPYKPVHQQYAAALAADVRTAGAAVRADTAWWQAAVEAHIRTMGFDAVVESAPADPDDFRAVSRAYRASHHRIEVVALATAEALSQMGIVDGLLGENAVGGGRYVAWDNHDRCATAMLTTLAVIETEHLADRITVVRRDGTVLYANERTSEGNWRRRTEADQVVRAERSRSKETSGSAPRSPAAP